MRDTSFRKTLDVELSHVADHSTWTMASWYDEFFYAVDESRLTSVTSLS